MSAPALILPPRASQKVRDFIFQEAKKRGENERWRLPSMRQLADHLDVSVATVQTVYSGLSREGYVTSAAKRGSFFHGLPRARTKNTLNIGLTFPWQDERHAWEGGIYAGMLDASLSCGSAVNFSRFEPPARASGEGDLRPGKGRPDGMIVLPGRLAGSWQARASGSRVPTAYLLPPDLRSVMNFICPDVAEASALVAEAFIAAGRRRLAFVEYVINDNKPYYILYRTGFMQTILDARGSLDSFRHIALGPAEGMAADLRSVLSRPDRPDAVLCGGDNMALALIGVAGELGLRIPEDLSVVGGSGVFFHDPRLASMTRVQQPVHEIGRELILLVESLINHPGRNQPGKYLPCGLLGGATTTPAEGELLRKMFARDRRPVRAGSPSAGSEAALA